MIWSSMSLITKDERSCCSCPHFTDEETGSAGSYDNQMIVLPLFHFAISLLRV